MTKDEMLKGGNRYVIVNKTKFTEEEVRQMSFNEITNLNFMIENRLRELNAVKTELATEFTDTHIPNPKFGKVQNIIALLHGSQIWIAQIKKQKARDDFQKKGLESHFMIVAREMLKEKEFNKILEEAYRRQDEDNKNKHSTIGE